MTKYMKITRTNGWAAGGELYIDLHKINRISEVYHSIYQVRVPGGSDNALRDYVNDAGYFSTHFSIPGERNMEVFGPAKEFITHIEEQQKRARKGKEIEPYEPAGTTVYASTGKVHGINDSLEPQEPQNRGRRELNSQTADYIEKIIETENVDPGDFDSDAVIDLFGRAAREAEAGTLSFNNYQLIHKAVSSIVAKAVKYKNSSAA